jgi:hypothetical protein
MDLWATLGIAPTTGLALLGGGLVLAAAVAVRLLLTRTKQDGHVGVRLND